MALHGDIRINGIIIGYWDAQRLDELEDIDGEYLYSCRYGEVVQRFGWDDVSAIEFCVSHRYSDGAAALAAKVLTAGEGGW